MSDKVEDSTTDPTASPPSPDDLVAASRVIADGLKGGGRLLVDGHGRAATDAHHVAVEFMHPVTVGKRAFPALVGTAGRNPLDVTMSIAYDGSALTGGVDIVLSDVAPADMSPTHSPADATGADSARRAAHASRPVPVSGVETGPGRRTCWLQLPADDPGEAKVTAVLSYHLLWELTQLFLESVPVTTNENAAVSALYPMLYERPDADPVDAALASAEAKIAESRSVRNRTLDANSDAIRLAADLLRDSRSVFAFGNGGSSTDAADAAIAIGPHARPLTDDIATITALANDVSFDVVFARQLATLGRVGDCAVGFSTSGNSPNVIEAARSARRIGMSTVGLAGYDGGAMATSGAFDVMIVVSSDSVHRIQEAQSDVIAHVVRAMGA